MRFSQLTAFATVFFVIPALRGNDAPASDTKKNAIDPAPPPLNASPPKVTWQPLIQQSFYFLGIQHAFRIATEPGTRNGTRGSYFKGYARSVASLHGWADGDPFYVNYIGHPIQGGVTNWIWTHNDPRYAHVEFGRSRDYWRSRLRATAFSLAYSAQFELGPLSEASIGQIQARYPQHGFVDHVVTPALGLGWMMAEDALDRWVIKKIEARTTNSWVRLLVRGGLNPTRSAANALRGEVPWRRDSRPGVLSYDPATFQPVRRELPPGVDRPGPAQFEVSFQSVVGFYGARTCPGGGAQLGYRLNRHWQWTGEVTGCQVSGLKRNMSADTLSYLTGPRWQAAGRGRLAPHVQLLVGGLKVSHEEVFPERKAALKPTALRGEWARFASRSGWMMSFGAGVELKLNAALALRLASVDYRKAWLPPVGGVDYTSNVRVSGGVLLRLGTW